MAAADDVGRDGEVSGTILVEAAVPVEASMAEEGVWAVFRCSRTFI